MAARGRGRPRSTSHEEIRAVAMRLFQEHGYSPTSLEQIAEAAGISRTTLFSYFPAKRDLVWEELDQGLLAVQQIINEERSGSHVDVIVSLLVRLARYRAADRETFAARWRLVQDNQELRAYGELQMAALSQLILEDISRRTADYDPVLIDHVARALMVVAARCTEEWSHGQGANMNLEQYTAEQLRPLAGALRPLLP